MKIQLKRSNVLTAGFAKEPTASQLEYGELAINYNTDDPAIFLKDSNNNIIRISGVGNIADDGQVELPASTTPPLNPLPGNLWYNSDDGRLYIYYADPNTEQWVDASPDSWDPSVIPDLSDNTSQSSTLDDRYLMLNAANDPITGGLNITGGNVGIGTSSPTEILEIVGNNSSQTIKYGDGTTGGYFSSRTDVNRPNADQSIHIHDFRWNGTPIARIKALTGDDITNKDNGHLTFETNSGAGVSERMRIDDSGDVLIHTTTNFPGDGNTSTGAMLENGSDGTTLFVSRSNNIAAYFNRNSNGTLVRFLRSGSEVGKVEVTATSTNYATSSDYRLKENIVTIDNAAERVMELKPCRFNFIAAPGTTVDGFLAHEAQAVVPEAVIGIHNEVDHDGNAVMQGIDQSKLVPLLTAALQETIARIETLESQVASLQASA